jgi:hypothetical protein
MYNNTETRHNKTSFVTCMTAPLIASGVGVDSVTDHASQRSLSGESGREKGLEKG